MMLDTEQLVIFTVQHLFKGVLLVRLRLLLLPHRLCVGVEVSTILEVSLPITIEVWARHNMNVALLTGPEPIYKVVTILKSIG